MRKPPRKPSREQLWPRRRLAVTEKLREGGLEAQGRQAVDVDGDAGHRVEGVHHGEEDGVPSPGALPWMKKGFVVVLVGVLQVTLAEEGSRRSGRPDQCSPVEAQQAGGLEGCTDVSEMV